MYEIKADKNFIKKYIKLINKNKLLEKRIQKTIEQLKENPKHSGLRTHQINDPDFGKVWSSWVHGDLRIFWQYEDDKIIILLLDIGSHDEVY